MEPFSQHTGLLAALDRSNVDTDQIIPKQFLKSVDRDGFGESLFFDWRYLPDGGINPDFALNQARFRGASILVTRTNFGCGSSREHAVWAVMQYGFRAVIGCWQQMGETRVPAFADIFRNNSSKNGLLTIELSPAEVDATIAHVAACPGLQAAVDLPRQEVVLLLPGQPVTYRFEMDPGEKERLLRGLDEISATLQHEESIAAFERTHDVQLPESC
jgi:3-isopropylmalate/(R)-2-methylmalate dehydratase small subunit